MDPLPLLIEGSPSAATVVLAHGAGAAMDSGWMNDLAGGLVDRGLRTVRFEFPYMQRRRASGKRGGPDRAPVLLDAWRRVVEQLGNGASLVIGGKSMGGRIASMVADEVGARGLICFGYPFHPPGRPERLRTDHLRGLGTPALFLQGTRDPFGKPKEVASYELSSRIDVRWLEDGDHSFKPRVRSGRTLEGNLAEAMDRACAFVSGLA